MVIATRSANDMYMAGIDSKSGEFKLLRAPYVEMYLAIQQVDATGKTGVARQALVEDAARRFESYAFAQENYPAFTSNGFERFVDALADRYLDFQNQYGMPMPTQGGEIYSTRVMKVRQYLETYMNVSTVLKIQYRRELGQARLYDALILAVSYLAKDGTQNVNRLDYWFGKVPATELAELIPPQPGKIPTFAEILKKNLYVLPEVPKNSDIAFAVNEIAKKAPVTLADMRRIGGETMQENQRQGVPTLDLVNQQRASVLNVEGMQRPAVFQNIHDGKFSAVGWASSDFAFHDFYRNYVETFAQACRPQLPRDAVEITRNDCVDPRHRIVRNSSNAIISDTPYCAEYKTVRLGYADPRFAQYFYLSPSDAGAATKAIIGMVTRPEQATKEVRDLSVALADMKQLFKSNSCVDPEFRIFGENLLRFASGGAPLQGLAGEGPTPTLFTSCMRNMTESGTSPSEAREFCQCVDRQYQPVLTEAERARYVNNFTLFSAETLHGPAANRRLHEPGRSCLR